MAKENIHGTLVIADGRGVLMTGPSGSGKTALALELMRYCTGYGLFGRLVCDDRVLLEPHHGRLVGRAVPVIGGQVEARGFGPALLPHEPATVIDLLVGVERGCEPPARLQYDETAVINTIQLPALKCSGSDLSGAVRAIAARLLLPPFTEKPHIID